jgi:hypothetical protein
MKKLTIQDVEGLRGELFHMILFSLAWALIGEYILDFRDYAAGAGVTLIVVVCLALYSIRLYNLEDNIQKGPVGESDAAPKLMKRDRLYALILVFEGIAVLVTWMILLNHARGNWIVAAFALIAGLHFFPLARLIRLGSYYLLGAWVCLLAIGGYWLLYTGRVDDHVANTWVAYGCALGGLMDGLGIMVRTRMALKR